MSLNDINTVLDILHRMGVDISEIKIEENPDWYERIILANKPSKKDIEKEFEKFLKEEQDKEAARQAEISRVENIKSRWYAMGDIRLILSGNITNPEIELKRIITENDQATLSQYEADYAVKSVVETKRTAINQKVKLGESALRCCTEILNYIAGHNLSEVKAESAVDAMEAAFAPILKELKNGRPYKAKKLISAVEADGVMVTQAMKDDVLLIFSKYGV